MTKLFSRGSEIELVGNIKIVGNDVCTEMTEIAVGEGKVPGGISYLQHLHSYGPIVTMIIPASTSFPDENISTDATVKIIIGIILQNVCYLGENQIKVIQNVGTSHDMNTRAPRIGVVTGDEDDTGSDRKSL